MGAGRRVALAVAMAAALSACGDGVSKADFVAKADGSCTSAAAPAASLAKPTSLPDLSTAAGTLAGAADAQAAGLRAAKPPSSDKAAVAGVGTAVADVAGAARALQDAATKTDDGATAKAATDLKAKADTAAAQAGTYGLAQCAKNLQAPATNVFEGGRSVVKAAFVAKADALCSAANRKVDALAPSTSLASEARYMTSYMPIEEKLFADIKALVVPPGEEATIADMLAAQDQVIAKDKEMLAAAQQRNQKLYDRLGEEEVPLITAANAKFDSYGLRNCGTLSNF